MARFRMSPEVLAELLDLPKDMYLGEVTRVVGDNDEHWYEFEVEHESIPAGDDVLIELQYVLNEGRVELQGFTPA